MSFSFSTFPQNTIILLASLSMCLRIICGIPCERSQSKRRLFTRVRRCFFSFQSMRWLLLMRSSMSAVTLSNSNNPVTKRGVARISLSQASFNVMYDAILPSNSSSAISRLSSKKRIGVAVVPNTFACGFTSSSLSTASPHSGAPARWNSSRHIKS